MMLCARTGSRAHTPQQTDPGAKLMSIHMRHVLIAVIIALVLLIAAKLLY
jgi:hypothetical protein